MVQIHASAVVSPGASLGGDVTVGPFCVVEDEVTVGDGCQLESHVVIKRGTTLGGGNYVGEGTVLGGRPQHLQAGTDVGRLVIGRDNTIREYVTIHRALQPQAETIVGDDNLIMVDAHVGHDSVLGNHTIIANNVMIGGHVLVEDHAYLSGAVGIHQFCRIGRYAMVGGQAHIVRDVPPYVTVDGVSSQIVGLNAIGLKRKGFDADELQQLKDAYRVLFRTGWKWADALAEVKRRFPDGPAAAFGAFLSASRRGCVRERRVPRAATLKLHRDDAAASERDLRKAG